MSDGKLGLEFIVINGKMFIGINSFNQFSEFVIDGIIAGKDVDEETKVQWISGIEHLKDLLFKETDKLNVSIELNDLGFPDNNLKVQRFEIK